MLAAFIVAAGSAALPAATPVLAGRQIERLDRGLVAVPATDGGNHVSWRLLGTDPATTRFTLYRDGKAIAVNLSKPKEKALTMPVGAVFPTEHMRRIIAAAREGKTILEFPVYDGSETGEKLYHTLTVIGRPIAPGEKPVTDAAAKVPELAKLTRWPVTISYFEQKSATEEQSGEQVPVYSISFELYENGISRALVLDYTDFTIAGEMTSLDLKKVKPCK